MIRILSLIIFSIFSLILSEEKSFADNVLVEYSFDDTSLPKVQDGFLIFENSKGFVDPSTAERFSGYRSLELQEQPVDGTFVELQGLFPVIDAGDVLFHFAILVENPDEELNIALAGPEHFYMKKDGINFWLKTIDGVLYQHSDSIPKKLFPIEANKWYVFDVVLHITKGTYDLRILDAAGNLLALVKDLANAANQPGSKLSKLSFIGDLADASSVHYFVDDVRMIALTSPIDLEAGYKNLKINSGNLSHTPTPTNTTNNHLATSTTNGKPSSRPKGYFDELLELKKLEFQELKCLPATSIADFGLERNQLAENPDLRDELKRVFSIKENEVLGATVSNQESEQVLLWRQGCLYLAAKRAKQAIPFLEKSLSISPGSTIARAALVAGYLGTTEKNKAEDRLFELYTMWKDDARLPVLLSMISRSSAHFKDAAAALSGVAGRIGEEKAKRLIGNLLVGDDAGFDGLVEHFGDSWKKELDDLYIGQGYYYSLLFSGKFAEAAEFSKTFISRYEQYTTAKDFWNERLGDAFALDGKYSTALPIFESLLSACAKDCDGIRRKTEELRWRESLK
jgi:hypothetical protein